MESGVRDAGGNCDNDEVKTLRLTVSLARLQGGEADEADNAALDRAAEILRGGGLVAMPTETVYGLGANALDATAVGRIFAAKNRPAWDPVIVHIAPIEGAETMLDGLVEGVPEAARRLMEAFWPGPLTLLLPRTAAVPDAVTAGRALAGVRMPAHPVALELIRRAGVPVAAPSANLFGHVSPTTAQHVLDDLDGRIDAVLDAGQTAHGVESTVLDACQSPMTIYRPGAVTAEQIRAVGGAVEVFRDGRRLSSKPVEALPSPGVGLRHYAPKARLVLVGARFADLRRAIRRRLVLAATSFEHVLLPKDLDVFLFEDVAIDFEDDVVHRERAGLVGAQHIHGAEVLDRVEALDDDLLPGHGQRALGQADRDDHRQHLRRQPHGDRQREEEGLLPIVFGQAIDEEDQRHHHRHEPDHQPSEPLDAAVEAVSTCWPARLRATLPK